MPKKNNFFRRTIFLVALIFLAAPSLFLLSGASGSLRKVLYPVVSPFQKIFYLGGNYLGDKVDFLKSISDLREENKKLLKENNILSQQVATLKDQKNENDLMRNELKLAPREKFDLEAAMVIGENPEKTGSWILIGKGSFHGVKVGMPVVVSEGILIGKVDEVFLNSARVRFLSDPEMAVNAVDLETGAKGIVRGEYGLGMILEMVEQSEVLNEGDILTTSGLGGDLPRGLLIGKVSNVRPSENKLFQGSDVIPRVKYSKLELVFVIKK